MKRIEFSENKLKLTGFKSFWKINNVLIFATSNLSIEKIHSRSSFELNKLVFRFIFTHFIIRRLKWFLFLHPFYYYLVTLCSTFKVLQWLKLKFLLNFSSLYFLVQISEPPLLWSKSFEKKKMSKKFFFLEFSKV